MTAGLSPQGVASPQGVVERDLMVRARDGVGLATDVYRPSGAGRFPVLLERTSYGKSAPSRSERTPYGKSAPSRSERTAAIAAPRSRAEASTRIRASPKARWSSRASPSTGCLSIASGPRT